jgi:hypothetical protein
MQKHLHKYRWENPLVTTPNTERLDNSRCLHGALSGIIAHPAGEAKGVPAGVFECLPVNVVFVRAPCIAARHFFAERSHAVPDGVVYEYRREHLWINGACRGICPFGISLQRSRLETAGVGAPDEFSYTFIVNCVVAVYLKKTIYTMAQTRKLREKMAFVVLVCASFSLTWFVKAL